MILLIAFYSCQVGKRVSDFKVVKHIIDTIAILPAFIDNKRPRSRADEVLLENYFVPKQSFWELTQ